MKKEHIIKCRKTRVRGKSEEKGLKVGQNFVLLELSNDVSSCAPLQVTWRLLMSPHNLS